MGRGSKLKEMLLNDVEVFAMAIHEIRHGVIVRGWFQERLQGTSNMGIVMQEDDTITQHATAIESDGFFTIAK
ncbi:hypothetical protein AVEN_77557-1 [Araneus ventricosus]|uniref:Uncharacterized protein n=1 Tax=Araneus ventricosus TaxID=182803 RepID=A0A4Y2IAD8_ARAVE|nr:hypothetical protein AVEN_77557-1 [Araneus ventricosus]